MRRGWIAASGVFLALFGGTVFLASKLALLDALGPGPGFFPLILGIIGAALAVVLIVQVMLQPAGAGDAAGSDGLIPDRPAAGRIFAIIAALAAAIFALDPLGYRVTALAFITLVLLALGVRNIAAIGAVALVGSFGVFHSFYYWLKVPLPIGAFGI